MVECEPDQHPADMASEQCAKERPIGQTSVVKFVSAYILRGRRIKAVGEGYGYGETSQEAREMALTRAKDSAARKLFEKIKVFSSAQKFLENLWVALGGEPRKPLVVSRSVEPELVEVQRLEPPTVQQSSLIAPHGTRDIHLKWEGRCEIKPWEYDVTVGMAHLNTPEELEVVVKVLRKQSIKPYIIVVDTGSSDENRIALERMRAPDLEIHYIAGHGYRHSSEPVAVALDLIQALCRTEHLFQTHTDVFLMQKDFLEMMKSLVNEKVPAVGYRMSPRDWATTDWEWMIGHTASMFHMPTLAAKGVTWSMQRMNSQFGISFENVGGWPDTETGFNHALRAGGIKPVFIGHDENYKRYTDNYIDHARSHAGTKEYAPDLYEKCVGWIEAAKKEALERIAKW